MDQSTPLSGAIIVLYFPQWDILQELLRSLKAQVSKIYLISNGMSDEIRDALKEFNDCSIVKELHHNLGLGKALNVGLNLANEDQCEYALLFDQDSLAPANYLNKMIAVSKKIPQAKKPWAALGPSFYDARSATVRVNQFKKNGRAADLTNEEESVISCDCLITSGMLINLEQLHPFPSFAESFFVDQVDSEWCFRMSAMGYGIYGTRKVRLAHRLSDSVARQLGPLTFLIYSPIRRYWYYKNSVILIRSSYVPLVWKLRLLGILILSFIPNLFLDKHAWSSGKMMISGLWEGLTISPQYLPESF